MSVSMMQHSFPWIVNGCCADCTDLSANPWPRRLAAQTWLLRRRSRSG